ncbi:MAG: cytochrome c peroxidase [Saprospiraceae bacterium]|nr:cytochrome c peroxidase [Saprospiraceae bacterium]
MTRIKFLATFFFLSMVTFLACNDEQPLIIAPEPNLPATLANYSEPAVESSYWIDQNRYDVTDAGATLGRVLFYDKILSRTNKVSCATCHVQSAGFGDGTALSSGVHEQVLTRHTPAIINTYDDRMLFWDGRTKSLEELVLKPVRNHQEMGLDNMDFLLAKLEKATYYPALFEDAFGSPEITQERITDALAQFVRSMVSARSKFDRMQAGLEEFNALEQLGQQVFFGEGRCYNCHLGQDFNERGGFFFGWSDPLANIGLDEEYLDPGAGAFDPERIGEFKIPSLRNVAVTAPYMHDGRFSSLEEVINHYNKNIQDHENLAFELRDWQTGGPARLGLDDNQVTALIRFLETLTDHAYLSDERFSDPFER